MTLPRNAQAIVRARLEGSRPADPVVVSYVGDTGWRNPHVFADAGQRYDWRFLLDLEVLIVVAKGVDVRQALLDIFAVARLYPTLIDLEQRQAGSVIDAAPLRVWPFTPRHPAWKELFA
jgi:hypothetical protein